MTFGAKRKSCDNHHPGLHLGQFDFHLNASSSLASIDPGVLLKLRTRFPLTLRTRFLIVYATGLAGHLCTSRKNIPAVVPICTSSTYKVTILPCEVVSLVIGIGQVIG